MREELPVELNVQVFLPLKCHRLLVRSHSWLPRRSSDGSPSPDSPCRCRMRKRRRVEGPSPRRKSEERRSLPLQTAAILYMHTITGAFNLPSAVLTHPGATRAHVSLPACLPASGGFCEPGKRVRRAYSSARSSLSAPVETFAM